MTPVADKQIARPGATMPAGLSTERLVKAFIAALVLAGFKSIPPRDAEVRRGLGRVVDKIDDFASRLLDEGHSFSEARPWIDAGNQLRLSPTGGVENWERAFRAAQLTFTQIGNPSYEIVTFVIDEPRAESELSMLDASQGAFVRDIADTFVAQVHGKA